MLKNYTTYRCAFGSSIAEMQYRSDSGSIYRYGFNTQEHEEEIAGEGNVYSAEYWLLDSRIGRRFNPDIVSYSNFSVYGVLANNPILYVDNFGDDWFISAKKFSGFTYGYKIEWIPSNAVIYDPAKSYYKYLGPSLTFGHLYDYAYISNYNKSKIAMVITAPLLGYQLAMNSKIVKTLNEDGYNSFGGYCVEKPNWLHKGYPGKSNGTDMSEIFMANENITLKNFYTVIMYSFLYGKGPENFYFTSEHEVSKSLTDSKLVTDALKMYKDIDDKSDNATKLRNGEWVSFEVGIINLPEILERAKKDGTSLNPEHLIGSAQVQITKSEDGKNYLINIWNTTSVGSGTIGIPSNQRPATTNNSAQPYTNVSQSYEIIIPIK